MSSCRKWERCDLIVHNWCRNIQILPWWVQHNQICSHSENEAISPQMQLKLVPHHGMKTWSEEGNAPPMSVFSMPVHGEKGKVVGRANFPLQLESWWEALFLSAPTVSPCSSCSVRLARYFKIALSHLAKHFNGLNAGFFHVAWQEKAFEFFKMIKISDF